MPKDKTASHFRIQAAMKAEFLEKGFMEASIRSIGSRAGLTSAALYRHYSSKEAMFSALVDPLIEEIQERMQQHKDLKYQLLDAHKEEGSLFGESIIDIVKEVIVPHKSEFLLLAKCSQGTKYEHYIHKFVEFHQGDLALAITRLKQQDYPAIELEQEELHMLLSAFVTAIIEPIIHEYPDEKLNAYLDRVNDFFMPGWMHIMGMHE